MNICVTEVIQEESSRVTESSSRDNRRIARELKSSEGEDGPKAKMKRNDYMSGRMNTNEGKYGHSIPSDLITSHNFWI